jgi:hypothetical protein
MSKPTVGRIVHYVLANGEHRPAIACACGAIPVNLQVFHDGGNDAAHSDGEWVTSRSLDETWTPRTWHWPERD